MTFEAKRAIAEILLKAEERLLSNSVPEPFYILSGILTDYFLEWGWWDGD